MIIDVIGVRNVEYDSKKNGKHVKGNQIFFLEEITNGGSGYRYAGRSFNGNFSPLFVSDSVVPMSELVPSKYDVYLDFNGNIVEMRRIVK